MTAEQLEELLGKVTPEDKDGEWCPDMDYEGNFENQDDMKLSVLAPSLARKVIAAEKLVEALNALSDHFNNGDKWSGESRSETISKVEQFAKRALTDYRAATKQTP